MWSWILLLFITVLYAGYNLLIKVSVNQVPSISTSTVVATICLQLAALSTSLGFALYLLARGNPVLKLPLPAYGWAAMAGVCIGMAEIGYFYLYRGSSDGAPLAANIVVPVIVSGTIVITACVSYWVFREPLSEMQLLGSVLIITGIGMLLLKA